MIIDRSLWHYGVLVRTYSPLYANPAAVPESAVNFCIYWRRVCLYAPLMVIGTIIAGIVATPVAIVLAIVLAAVVAAFATIVYGIGFLMFCTKAIGMFFIGRIQVVGFRRAVKAWFKGDQGHPDRAFRAYKSILRIGGHNISPLEGIIYVLVGFGMWKFLQSIPQIATSAMQHTEAFGILGRIGLSSIIVLAMVLIWRTKTVREVRHLTGEFIKAKKQRICPLIEFVGEFPGGNKTTDQPQTS